MSSKAVSASSALSLGLQNALRHAEGCLGGHRTDAAITPLRLGNMPKPGKPLPVLLTRHLVAREAIKRMPFMSPLVFAIGGGAHPLRIFGVNHF